MNSPAAPSASSDPTIWAGVEGNAIAIGDALIRLLGPFGEVVVHDLVTGTICFIDGSFSNRKVGGPSFIDDIDFTKDEGPVFGPYQKINPDGRKIKTISVLLRDGSGNPRSLLCINMDISRFDAAHAALARFISIPEEDQDNPLADDWLDTLNRFVANWKMERGLTDAAFSAETRHELLAVLIKQGVFDRPKAADAIARALGVSRATIYNDLKLQER